MTIQIELNDVDKHYGSFQALKDINLSIERGLFVALVGPSGCGKSTLLRTLAGLESFTSGTMKIAGQSMAGVPPRKRDIAMVFQSYALYPHMTVERNLTYSLRLNGSTKEEAKKKAHEVADVIGLSNLLGRYPRELSGGQRQRVAMGRAIIRDPRAFLFDEPLSNLDAGLRVHMRKEIRALHDRLGATFVYVTHDQIEAMTMADHVVVMRDGIIEQQAPPLVLFDKPDNKFVAGFIGSPSMNFIDGVIGSDGKSAQLSLQGNPVIQTGRDLQPGREVTVGFRPEDAGPIDEEGGVQVTLSSVESTGSVTYLTTATMPELTLVHSARTNVLVGNSVSLNIPKDKIYLFDRKTEKSI